MQSTPSEREDGQSTSGGLGQSQVRQSPSTTPSGAPLGLKHTTSLSTPEHRPRQLPPHSHTDSDAPRLRPPVGPTPSRDTSGHNRGTLREDNAHGPGENIVRPSGPGSGERFHSPEPPVPASIPPPHRPLQVGRPLTHPQTTTDPNQAELQYTRQTSDLDNTFTNRRDDQPIRE